MKKILRILILLIVILMMYTHVYSTASSYLTGDPGNSGTGTPYAPGQQLQQEQQEQQKQQEQNNKKPSTGGTNGKDAQTSVPSGKVDPDAYKPKELTTSDAGEFIDIANSVIGAIRIFGTVVAVVALMTLGIKYMLGSVQDKATYKETMIPYIVGAVMVFAIPNIIGIILDLVSQIKF